MAKKRTNIGYVDYTINPYGWYCRKISPGCQHCYMHSLARRHGRPDPAQGFATRWEKAEQELAGLPTGATIFLNDMSDTYYELASDDDVMRCHQLAVDHPDKYFMIVTKRPERAYHMNDVLVWPDNLWLAVSVESPAYIWRISVALLTGAQHVAISAEPLLEPIADELWRYLDVYVPQNDPFMPENVFPTARGALRGIDGILRGVEWVIAGGESGPGRRPFYKRWALVIAEVCRDQNVAFFFKQGSALRPGQDRLLEGSTWDEIPVAFGGDFFTRREVKPCDE